MATVHQERFLDSMSNLIENQKYSDITINCRGHLFPVHKAIVCSVLLYFTDLCESRVQEALRRVHNHKEYDPATMQRMISYIYKQTYEIDGEDKLDIDDSKMEMDGVDATHTPVDINQILIAHVEVYGIADYFRIPKLKLLATERFTTVAERAWQMDGFIDVVKNVKERTMQQDRAMRNTLREYAMNHRLEATDCDAFMSELAESNDLQDLCADMFRELVHQQAQDKDAYDRELTEKDRQIALKDQRIQELEADEGLTAA